MGIRDGHGGAFPLSVVSNVPSQCGSILPEPASPGGRGGYRRCTRGGYVADGHQGGVAGGGGSAVATPASTKRLSGSVMNK